MCPWLVPDPVPGGSGTAADDDPDGTDAPVRAMPVVLRIERPGGEVPPPVRSDLLAASADAALALCLDERSAPGGPWYDAVAAWAGAGRIRKVARRARTSHWRAVQDVDGLTVGRGSAEVRALVPGPVDEVPHEVRRLQIGGTDLPDDPAGPPPPDGPVVWLNPTVEQSTGKAAAQVGHASMILAVVLAAAGGDPREALGVSVRTASPTDWETFSAVLGQDGDGGGREAWERHGIAPVRDAGFTEVAPGTVTCVAQSAAGRARG